MVASGKSRLQQSASETDYTDYIVLVAILMLAVLGYRMWTTLKDQQKTLAI